MTAGCATCGVCCDPVHLDYPMEQLTGEDLQFAGQHWAELERSPKGKRRFRCDQFNSETRLCTAHGSRPPICAGYPWYGGQPNGHLAASPPVDFHQDAALGCSYLADLPVAWRPAGQRPLIPIEVL